MDLWALSFNGSYQNASNARFRSNIWIKTAITPITIPCKNHGHLSLDSIVLNVKKNIFFCSLNDTICVYLSNERKKSAEFFVVAFVLFTDIDKVGCTSRATLLKEDRSKQVYGISKPIFQIRPWQCERLFWCINNNNHSEIKYKKKKTKHKSNWRN